MSLLGALESLAVKSSSSDNLMSDLCDAKDKVEYHSRS